MSLRVIDSLGAVKDPPPQYVILDSLDIDTVSTTVFEDAALEGSTEDDLIDVVSGVLGAVNENTAVNVSKAVQLRKAAFKALKKVTVEKRNQSLSTLDDVARAATALKQVLFDTEQIEDDDIAEFAPFITTLLEDASEQDFVDSTGVEDGFFEDILEVRPRSSEASDSQPWRRENLFY